MKPAKIVLIGHVCIDRNTTERAAYTGWGSPVLYMSEYYRKSGYGTPIVVASYGPDMLEYLPEVALLPTTPNLPTTMVYENDTSSSPRIWKCHNFAAAVAPAITPGIAAAIREADIIILATLLPNYSAGYVRELLGHARVGCLKVLCPQGYFRQIGPDEVVQPRDFSEARDIVPQFDLVVYSADDHPKAMALAKEWGRPDGAVVIVTEGENGATIVRAGELTHVPTMPIPPEEIVDSVGCGDVFAATVAREYCQTKDLKQSVQMAHKAAAGKLKTGASASRSSD